MEAKLRQLMKHEGINSTRLAEILGIQASGISHIMSGRNKPSFDFLLKLLQRFPQINPDWLLLDKGSMYRDEIKNKNHSPTAGVRTGGQGTGGNAYAQGGVTTRRVAGSGSPEVVGGMGDAVSPEIADSGATGMTGAAGGAADGGLFGPDNDDIIRSGVNIGGSGGHSTGTGGHYSGADGHIGGRNTGPDGRPGLHSGAQTGQPSHRAPSAIPSGAIPLSGQQAAYPTGRQTGSLMRTASIERIVVFYKDKTFSEYQPE